MAETAAFLVDHVLPRVPVRQWVLSLPIELRYRLAYDSRLTARVLRIFMQTVFGSLRRRARKRWGRKRYLCGSVTFVQRFGDALNLNVHFHSVVLDGVYVVEANGGPRFRRLPAPSDAEVERVTRSIVRRLRRLLLRCGLGPETEASDADPLESSDPLLAEIYAASVRSRSAMAERSGRKLLRIGQRLDAEEAAFCPSPRCASVDGVSLHANVAVPAHDRRRLETLFRYVARPPVSTQRLSRLDDGKLLYRLKKRWRDGTTHVVFEPIELLEKLVAIVPPPRCHLVRYHGALAPRARCRRAVVSSANAHATQDLRRPDSRITAACTTRRHAAAPNPKPERTRRRWIPWAELMRRVFAIDVLQCPRCKGSMRVLELMLPPDATRALLDAMCLPARAPPLGPARYDAGALEAPAPD